MGMEHLQFLTAGHKVCCCDGSNIPCVFVISSSTRLCSSSIFGCADSYHYLVQSEYFAESLIKSQHTVYISDCYETFV